MNSTTPNSITRFCGCCGTPLARKTYNGGRLEALAMFKARKTCDRKCTGLLKSKNESEKSCEQCDKPLVRRSDEPSGNFKVRKFCNNICRGKHMTGNNNYKMKKPVITPVITAPPKVVSPAPRDAQQRVNSLYYKATERGVFRHDGYEWVKSTMSLQKLKRAAAREKSERSCV